MAGVMYQGYASYLQAYQRHSASSYCSPTPSFAFNPYDKKYRFHDVSGGIPSPAEQSSSHSYHASPTSVPVPASVSSPEAVSTPAAPTPSIRATATTPSSSSSTGNVSGSPAVSQPRQQSSSSEQEKSLEDKSDDYADAHYLSANCVVLTYFSGDLATAVDEHFSRALNQSYSKGSKGQSDPCPMSERNLPPSFWNSQYHAGYAAAGGSFTHESLYSDYSGFHGLPQPDPWAYNLTAAQQYSHHHRAVSDFTYMPSTSRYSHNYSSLLMGRPRIPQCVVGKSDPWNPSARLHDDVTFDPASYAHHFPSMAGLESAGSSLQDHSKDLYWI